MEDTPGGKIAPQGAGETHGPVARPGDLPAGGFGFEDAGFPVLLCLQQHTDPQSIPQAHRCPPSTLVAAETCEAEESGTIPPINQSPTNIAAIAGRDRVAREWRVSCITGRHRRGGRTIGRIGRGP